MLDRGTFVLSTTITAIVLSVAGLLQSAISARINKKEQFRFEMLFLFLLLYNAANTVRILAVGMRGMGANVALRFALFAGFFFAMAVEYIISTYLLSLIESKSEELLYVLMTWLLLLELLFLVITQFTDLIYVVDPFNQVRRGVAYPFLYLFPVSLLILDICLFAHGKERLQPRERGTFRGCFYFPLAGMIGHLLFGAGTGMEFTSIIAAVTIYIFLLSDQTARFLEQEKENEALRTDIMLSQIQPHFLYNSLSVIGEICRSDPEKAENAIGEFSRFLRHNMDSLSGDRLISFEKELEHTRRYLMLQKLRFEDDLSVRYDLENTNFLLPPLTLQPLVENAVSHGIREKESGRGTVLIRTREFGDRFEITVKDDGNGMTSCQEMDKKHVGIQNVRTRLENICGGDLVIRSVPSEGTTAVIILPKGVE